MAKEAEYLGVYVSGHPVETYDWLAQQRHTQLVSTLTSEQPAQILVYITKVERFGPNVVNQWHSQREVICPAKLT
ncbi:hypothetical protein TUA1478L_29160 [Lactiplantibacillus plantarum]